MIDVWSKHINKFNIEGNRVEYTGADKEWTQMLGAVPFRYCNTFTMRVVKTRNRNIRIGIVDSNLIHEKYVTNE